MAPPSEVSWDSLSNTIREQHPDIIAAHENATSEVRGLLSELNHLAASSGRVLCSVAIQIGFTCGVWPHDPVSAFRVHQAHWHCYAPLDRQKSPV